MNRKRYTAVLLLAVLATVQSTLLSADGMSMIDPDLIGTWSWVSADTPAGSLSPMNNMEYTVTFTEDGRVLMKFEINSINGSYEADGKILAVNPPMAMTLAAWQPASPAPALLKMMEKSRDYGVSGDKLSITASSAAGTMRFVRQ